MDPSLAESMGLDTENLLLSRPSSAENLLSGVNTLTKSGSVHVVVVDSVSNYVSKNVLYQLGFVYFIHISPVKDIVIPVGFHILYKLAPFSK